VKAFIYILVGIVLASCDEEKNNRLESRYAYIYHTSEPNIEEFVLRISELNDTIEFRYISKVDTSKIIEIKKSKMNDSLVFWHDSYVRGSDQEYRISEIDLKGFGFYVEEEPQVDGTGPFLFNEQYGFLGIHNNYGPSIIFLNEENLDMAERIVDELNDYK
jgi:hypothetical protein